jgi:hypothetical protein
VAGEGGVDGVDGADAVVAGADGHCCIDESR